MPESTIPGVKQRNDTLLSSFARPAQRQFIAALEHAYGAQAWYGSSETPDEVICTWPFVWRRYGRASWTYT
jgi:hypothetical protein